MTARSRGNERKWFMESLLRKRIERLSSLLAPHLHKSAAVQNNL